MVQLEDEFRLATSGLRPCPQFNFSPNRQQTTDAHHKEFSGGSGRHSEECRHLGTSLPEQHRTGGNLK